MTKRLRTKSKMAQQVRDLRKDPLASTDSSRGSGQKADYGSSVKRKRGRPKGSQNKPKSEVKTFTKQQRNKATAVHRGITQGTKGQRERTSSGTSPGELKKPRKGLSAKIRSTLARVPLRAIVLGGGGGSDSPGQPGLKHGKIRKEPKLQ